jgi:transcriptional regulator
MYVPTSFRMDDLDVVAAFLRDYPFATLVTTDQAGPFASHVPLLHVPSEHGPGVLRGHLARANPQWKQLATGQPILAIFHGPHAYVSPTWYVTSPAVPTWNYAVVHVTGTARMIEAPDELLPLVAELVQRFEAPLPQPWSGALPADYQQGLLAAIIGFEISITRVEAKFKLGQNRSAADQAALHDQLAQSDDPRSRSLAALMSRPPS